MKKAFEKRGCTSDDQDGWPDVLKMTRNHACVDNRNCMEMRSSEDANVWISALNPENVSPV
jgi:hypothetical protein